MLNATKFVNLQQFCELLSLLDFCLSIYTIRLPSLYLKIFLFITLKFLKDFLMNIFKTLFISSNTSKVLLLFYQQIKKNQIKI